MQEVELGTRVKPLGINRTVVADNCKCRAILIDRNPRIKYIAWDDNLKRKVEVTQDLIIRYGLRPMTNFYYLIAKLNTDMGGNVVGNNFVVEYLQLTENVNNEFADSVAENPNFNSITLTKVKKSVEGKDYGYIKAIPSQYSIDPAILTEVDKLAKDRQAVEAIWTLIDKTTSVSAEEYVKLKANPNQNQIAAPKQEHKQVEAPKPRVTESPMPQFTAQDNDFAEGEGFNDDDFNDM